MLLQHTSKTGHQPTALQMPFLTLAPDLSRVVELKMKDEAETLAFLNKRPVHTVIMTSWILDNGIESDLNRGRFFGYRNEIGELEGVALIGHNTLIEARSDEALKAFAFAARESKTPINLIMSNGNAANEFWEFYGDGFHQPRLTSTELLFEVGYPFMVPTCNWDVRLAKPSELTEIAEAHAEVVIRESGNNPMENDREGFMKRVLRRIELNRVFVVYNGDELVFKADIMAETSEVIYLEGGWVNPEYRRRDVGSSCLAKLTLQMLKRVPNICLLSNINFIDVHMMVLKAGFKNTGSCTAIFT